MKETYYICQCGFVGTEDSFNTHKVYDGHDYGHGDAAHDEYELECPECGNWEEDGIEEAVQCEDCQDYFFDAQIIIHNGHRICEGCLSYGQLYDITKKGDTNE